jgi:gliding motility-associated-like protein
MKRLLLAAGFLIGFFSLNAQLVTTGDLTVEQYVQNVLLGQNVTVSNITYNGGPANVVSPGVGGFDCPNCNLGILSGFAMTTGDVAGLVGPNGTGGFTGTGTGGIMGQDPDLLALIQEVIPGADPNFVDVNDWIIIEFDFVPLGDTLQFQYVWASEEYDEWVGTDYNDIFGFFISGPGINGPYANNADNIARVPVTNAPVAIGTINNGNGNTGPCTSCEYYNQDGQFGGMAFDAPEHTDPYYMQMDGYTDVLTATAIVQCGQTFHIKLAICDTSDPSMASSVFLQRDSFSSNLVVQTTLNLTAGGPNGDTMYETCSDGYIVFQRPTNGDPSQQLIAELEFTGTAVNGVDYTAMPSSITFAPNQMEVSLYIDAFDNDGAEGQETVIMNITNIAECSDATISSTFEFYINDLPEPLQVQGVDYTICQGAVQTLEPIITGGYANYGYTWSTGETTETIDVNPLQQTTYFLTVSDTCGLAGDNSQFVVDVLVAQPLIVDIVDQDNAFPLSCGDFATIYSNVSGGIAPYQYSWTDEDGTFLSGGGNAFINTGNAGMITLTVTDECNFEGVDQFNVIVNVPELTATMPAIHTVTCGSNCNLTVVPSGGDTQGFGYNYEWQFNGVNDWNYWGLATYSAPAAIEGTITAIVYDQCGQSVEVESQLVIESPPIDLTLPQNLQGNCQTIISIIPVISGGSGPIANWDYDWTANGAPIVASNTLNSAFGSDQEIGLFVTDACGATASASTTIDITNPLIDLTLGEDIDASCIDNTLLTPTILGGSGGFQYQWLVDDEVEGTQNTLSFQTFTTQDVVLLVNDICSTTTSDTITINIPSAPLVVTASADTAVCENISLNLWASATGGEGPYLFEWNNEFSGDMLTAFPEMSTVYTVVARDICGRVAQHSVNVEVKPIVANFNVVNMGNQEYEFTAMPLPECVNCMYEWDFGDGENAADSVVVHQFDGLSDYVIFLTTTNEIGCINTQQFQVLGTAYFYVPNSFTPNGDGLNDVFRVVGRGFSEYELTIFNRWGAIVFHSTDPDEVWVGEGGKEDYYAPNEAYGFTLRVKGYDTETIERQGSIKILR